MAPRRGGIVPLVVLGVITVLVLAAYFTPLLGVRNVEVKGVTTLREPEVLQAAGIEQGKPMLQLNTDEIRSRLRTVPKVASADVRLLWPSTVRLRVAERVPVAFTVARGGIQLVDASGVVFAPVPQPPAGLPELRASVVAPDDPAARAALEVLRVLPPAMRGEVTTIIAPSPESVQLLLKGEREVHWGSAQDSDRKAAILPALLTRPGKIYDVTSPALPTVV